MELYLRNHNDLNDVIRIIDLPMVRSVTWSETFNRGTSVTIEVFPHVGIVDTSDPGYGLGNSDGITIGSYLTSSFDGHRSVVYVTGIKYTESLEEGAIYTITATGAINLLSRRSILWLPGPSKTKNEAILHAFNSNWSTPADPNRAVKGFRMWFDLESSEWKADLILKDLMHKRLDEAILGYIQACEVGLDAYVSGPRDNLPHSIMYRFFRPKDKGRTLSIYNGDLTELEWDMDYEEFKNVVYMYQDYDPAKGTQLQFAARIPGGVSGLARREEFFQSSVEGPNDTSKLAEMRTIAVRRVQQLNKRRFVTTATVSRSAAETLRCGDIVTLESELYGEDKRVVDSITYTVDHSEEQIEVEFLPPYDDITTD